MRTLLSLALVVCLAAGAFGQASAVPNTAAASPSLQAVQASTPPTEYEPGSHSAHTVRPSRPP